MEKHEVSAQSVNLLKIQRHDFINHLQVIHTLLQLGRTQKAITYIEELSKNPSLVSAVLQTYEEKSASVKV